MASDDTGGTNGTPTSIDNDHPDTDNLTTSSANNYDTVNGPTSTADNDPDVSVATDNSSNTIDEPNDNGKVACVSYNITIEPDGKSTVGDVPSNTTAKPDNQHATNTLLAVNSPDARRNASNFLSATIGPGDGKPYTSLFDISIPSEHTFSFYNQPVPAAYAQ